MVKQPRVLYFCVILFCSIQGFLAVKKDVVFVVDKSGSIDQSDFDTAIDFLKDTITALTIGVNDVQVSVVSFSDTYNEEFDLNDNADQASLLTAVNGLKSSISTNGGTFTANALNYVQSFSFTTGKGARTDAGPIVIVMTDGLSQNTAQTTTAANLIRSSINDSIIYVIGIGADLSSSTDELLHIASDPDADNVMYVTSFLYICNLVPTLAVKIDSSVTVSVASDCTQTTTTVFVGKGGVVTTTTTATTTTTTPTTTTTTPTTTTTTPTTTTTTPTTTTTTPTTTTATGTTTTGTTTAAIVADVQASSSFAEDNIPAIAGGATAGAVVVSLTVAAAIYRYKKLANKVVDISKSGP
ncbi:cell wall protein DAN4-like [Mizuhopecten yessoensis]|uniref:cell wall protein DAN4-like n=1 Tax=Mizuhopecten yessoensis TaxID=6573 RepID=UPI000B45D2F9|nr:cell wall protein DAN4-like [Mizuhopecten yessoensis]